MRGREENVGIGNGEQDAEGLWWCSDCDLGDLDPLLPILFLSVTGEEMEI